MPEKPDAATACRGAITHWSSLRALATFALERHGYGDSNGGFGVTYPGDLDEFDREAEGRFIPEGFIVVYGFWGPPDGYEVFVAESYYLAMLARILAEAGFTTEAREVLLFRHSE